MDIHGNCPAILTLRKCMAEEKVQLYFSMYHGTFSYGIIAMVDLAIRNKKNTLKLLP